MVKGALLAEVISMLSLNLLRCAKRVARGAQGRLINIWILFESL